MKVKIQFSIVIRFFENSKKIPISILYRFFENSRKKIPISIFENSKKNSNFDFISIFWKFEKNSNFDFISIFENSKKIPNDLIHSNKLSNQKPRASWKILEGSNSKKRLLEGSIFVLEGSEAPKKYLLLGIELNFIRVIPWWVEIKPSEIETLSEDFPNLIYGSKLFASSPNVFGRHLVLYRNVLGCKFAILDSFEVEWRIWHFVSLWHPEFRKKIFALFC